MSKVIEQSEQFIDRLAKLDTGELAVLRRNAGNTLAQSRGVYGLFYRLLPATAGNRAEVFFLVASLYGLNKLKVTGDFGQTMRLVKQSSGSANLDRRMAILLDSSMDLMDLSGGGELGYRLRQCVKVAASKGVGVDWVQLLADLLQWSYASKSVQKKWARSYFGDRVEDKKEVEANVS